MNKIIVYTSNIGFVPKNLAEVIEFAKDEPKFYIANVELNSYLANVKAGDNIITTKGNSVYVIKTFDQSLDSLCEEGRDYIDDLTRNYDLKKANITGVKNVIKYASWCKSAAPLLNTSTKTATVKKNNSIKGFSEKMKNLLMPTEAEGIRVSQDGNICVETEDGYVTIDSNNNLISYPEEFTFALPVYTISKPADQLAAGDVILVGKDYSKVVAIKDGKIKSVSYTGRGRTTYMIKDFLLNQSMVRVVVSLAGNLNGQMNPLMLLALSKDGDSKDSLLPLLLMNQNQGNVGAGNINPLMLLALGGEDKGSFKDLAMMSMLSGGTFNLFGGAAPAATSPVAPAAAVAEEDAD